MSMRTVTASLLAGAAGTAALNAVTYLDMAVRARAASSQPEQAVQRLADTARVSLGDGKAAEHRKAGLGALLGYATGLAAAACYGLLAGRRLPWPAAALSLTALATAGSNVPMALLGLSDPRRWSASEWAADLVPHLAYGAVAASTLRRLHR